MRKTLLAGGILAIATLSTGCATALDGGEKFTRITSDVSPVPFEVRDKDGNLVAGGDTPEYVKLDPDAGLFSRQEFTVRALSPKGETVEGSFNAELNHKTWLSHGIMPVYGFAGQVIDWFTGAIWTTPEQFEIRMPIDGIDAPEPKPEPPSYLSRIRSSLAAFFAPDESQ
jgi:hypothetical protein